MGLFRPAIKRSRKDGTTYSQKTRVWWGSFKHPVTGKRIRCSLKTTDRNAAQLMYSQLIQRAYEEKAGFVNPYEKHLQRPLKEHLGDWRQSLVEKDATPQYIKLSYNRVHSILEGINAPLWKDIEANKVSSYLAERRNQGLSIESSNHYLRRFKQFCKWIVTNQRAPHNPVDCLVLLNSANDQRRERRALLPEELRQLITTTMTEPKRFGLTGVMRAMLYRVVCETGLRAKESRSNTSN